MAQWSALPGDILSSISKILNSDIDVLRLRSVCSSWRSSLPPARKPFTFPLKVPLLRLPSDCNNGYCIVKQNTLYRLSPPESGSRAGNSSDGWLFKVSETGPNSFSLLVPLSADKIKYPPGTVPKHLNLLNYRISEICKSYSVDFVNTDGSSEQCYQPYIIRKVIVFWNYVVDCDFVVLILRHGGGINYWKLGDEEWTPVDAKGYFFHDVIIFDGKCYAIDYTGVLVSFDSMLKVTVVASSVGYLPTQQNYLVEYKSDLYAVCKISSPEPDFYFDYADEWPSVGVSTIDIPLKLTVFKKKSDDWDYVGDLGDMVLFLGDDVSFAVSPLAFGGFKCNCVFLTDECFYDDGVGSVYGDDTGVYDLDNRSIKALVGAQDLAKIFWPPPTWLPFASSSGDVLVDDLESFKLQTREWSTLPGAILSSISKNLNSDISILRLRSVCSSWRSSLPPAQKPISFPLQVPPLCSPSDCNGYFVVKQNTLYRLSPPKSGACAGNPSDGWLFKVSETGCNSFSLLVPLSTDKIKYPPRKVSKHLNLLNYRISEICKSYSVNFVNTDESSTQYYQPYIIRKVIVLWNYVVDYDCVVLILRYGGGMNYWKLGDKKWTPVNAKGYSFHDVIIFEGKCYAVDITGVLVSFDSMLNLTVVASSVGYLPTQQNYLVEYMSDLYVVCKISSPEPEFYFDYVEEWPSVDVSTIDIPLKLTVFKKKGDDWDYVGDLGDMVLFLGDDVSFAVSTLDFGGFKRNCVFLTDECFYDDGVGSVYGDDTGVYDLANRSIKALGGAQDLAKIFWPPPTWLPFASSSGDVLVDDLESFKLQTREWSALPGAILSSISKNFNSDISILRLQSVCSSWRISLPPAQMPISFPLQVPPIYSLSDCNGYFVVKQNTLYRLSPPESGACAGNSSDGWLFKISETGPNSFSLLVPLSADKIKYPPGTVSKHLNLLNYRISEICKSYSVDFVNNDDSSEQYYQPYIIRKVIVLWNYMVDYDCVVLILRYGGGMDYWKLGDEKWTTVNAKGYSFHDVIIFDGKCYAIDITGVLVSFDSMLKLTVVASSVGYLPTQQNYLVEYKSDLYVVCKISSPEPEFYFDYEEVWSSVDVSTIDIPLKLTVFKKKGDDWDYVGDLGDMVLFLGDDVSFAVSTLDFGGFKHNCVFLTDECFYDDGVGSVYGDDTGVYDLDNRSIKALVGAQDLAKIFWPPPTWLPCAGSSGDELMDDLDSLKLQTREAQVLF